MDHVRPMLPTVRAHEGHVEALRQVEIELDGGELPRALQRVLNLKVDLRPIESALARLHLVGQTLPLHGLAQGLRSALPVRGVPDELLRPGGEVSSELGEPKGPQNVQGKAQDVFDLFLHLIRSTDDVRVVLGKPTHPKEPVQNARALETVNGAKLAIPNGKLPIGPGLRLVDGDVEGAVHGLQEELLALNNNGGVHALTVEIEVPGGLPKPTPPDMRGVDELVARLIVLGHPEILDDAANTGTLRMPKDEPRPDHVVLDGEKVKLRPKDAMVTPARFLSPFQVLFQLLRGGKGRAIDAGEHVPVGIPAPIGAREVQELEVAHEAGGGEVGAAAEVQELALAIKRDPLPWDLREELELIILAAFLENPFGLSPGQPDTLKGEILAHDLAHLLFNAWQILMGDGAWEKEVVVEAVGDGGADGQFRPGEEARHGVGQHMGCGVA